ncbi:hypothetical protein B0H14DRAFT_3423960 [Mycena olivaceomarginata]|nr:hypothetical protein B0H14DRAFT_3423960 [Mycena olivaceomarginata]
MTKIDNVFTLVCLIDKAYDSNKPLYVAYLDLANLDLKNAFPGTDRSTLWVKLAKMGVSVLFPAFWIKAFVQNTNRPDLAFSANRLSAFLQDPGPAHWKAIQHLLAYIKGRAIDSCLQQMTLGMRWNSSGLEDDRSRVSKLLEDCNTRDVIGPIPEGDEQGKSHFHTGALLDEDGRKNGMAARHDEIVLPELTSEVRSPASIAAKRATWRGTVDLC